MTLYLIGLGLGDEKDITLRGYEAIKSCDVIYLDIYTSILGITKQSLEKFYEKEIIEADREMIEEKIDKILESGIGKKMAFLVVGDPLCATTHMDMYLRAIKKGFKVEVVHNASILTAIAATGMLMYRFGECVTIPLFTST